MSSFPPSPVNLRIVNVSSFTSLSPSTSTGDDAASLASLVGDLALPEASTKTILKFKKHNDRLLSLASVLLKRSLRRSAPETSATSKGKPYFPPSPLSPSSLSSDSDGEARPVFSVSHHSHLAVLASEPRHSRLVVGVDVVDLSNFPASEELGKASVEEYAFDTLGTYLSAGEVAYLRERLAEPAQSAPARTLAIFHVLWGLKEAYAKALGHGLSLPLGSLSFDLSAPDCVSFKDVEDATPTVDGRKLTLTVGDRKAPSKFVFDVYTRHGWQELGLRNCAIVTARGPWRRGGSGTVADDDDHDTDALVEEDFFKALEDAEVGGREGGQTSERSDDGNGAFFETTTLDELVAQELLHVAAAKTCNASTTCIVPYNYALKFHDSLKSDSFTMPLPSPVSPVSLTIQQSWKAGGKGGTTLGFGASVYPSAVCLSLFFCDTQATTTVLGRPLKSFDNVLELGCGPGLLGLAVGIVAMQEKSRKLRDRTTTATTNFVLTDGDEQSVALAGDNVQRNVEHLKGGVTVDVSVARLLWGDVQDQDRVLAENLRGQAPDLIIMSDVAALVYRDSFDFLVQSLLYFTGGAGGKVKSTPVVVAYQRRDKCEDEFFRLLERAGFSVEKVERELLHEDFRNQNQLAGGVVDIFLCKRTD